MEPTATSPNGTRAVNGRATTFLAKSFDALAHRVEVQGNGTHFDVVIIGSGYGAAVAASQFSSQMHKDTGQPVSVCVLERGKERLAGSFPTGFSELPGELRFSTPGQPPGGNMNGLFDIRLGTKASAVVANGLGGGSLINAGVMLTPQAQVLDSWPDSLGGAEKLHPYYVRAQRALGVLSGPENKPVVNSIDSEARTVVDKYRYRPSQSKHPPGADYRCTKTRAGKACRSRCLY